MGSKRASREPFDAIATFVTTHWIPLVGLLAASAFLSGFNYFHGYYGRLGFDVLVHTREPIMYLAYGGIAAAFSLTANAVILMAFAPLASFAGYRLGRNSTSLEDLEHTLKKAELAAPFAAGFTIAIVAILPWQWIIPELGRILSFGYPYGMIAFGLLLVLSYTTALIGLRGKACATFAIGTLLLVMPGLTLTLGEHNAARLMNDPDTFPRVLIWYAPEQTTPTGYVLVHQEDDRLYLLLIQQSMDPGANKTIKLYKPTTKALDEIHHIEYVPAGVEVERVHRRTEVLS